MKKEKEGNEVAVVQKDMNPESLIRVAIEKGISVESLERLLAMRTQVRAEQAKMEYDRAMADFQAECPTIVKTKEVRTNTGGVAYRYAPIESIVAQVKDLLQKHGFSYSTTMELLEAGVKVVCRVTHASGHSQESPMQVPFGNKTNVMSQTQVVAAATTFAKRYAFCNAFGILTGDEDTDARAGEAQKERMDSYQVRRVINAEDDEADGYYPPADKEEESNRIVGQPPYPKMNETNDAAVIPSVAELKALKMDIANLLKRKWNFTMLGKSHTDCENKIFDLTGIMLKEENYKEIVKELTSL